MSVFSLDFVYMLMPDPITFPQNVKFDPLIVWDGLRHATDPPTPLERLARRLFAVIANSASCERLFSTYGNILTKRRSRMATQTLASLAELKMHLCDLHMKEKSTRTRLRRQFGTAQHGTAQSISGQVSSEAVDEGDGLEGGTDTGMTLGRSLRTEAEHLMSLADKEGEDDGGEDVTPQPGQSSTRPELMSLQDLFDFENTFWITNHTKSSTLGLQEELELYELLDLDEHGDEDEDDALPDDV